MKILLRKVILISPKFWLNPNVPFFDLKGVYSNTLDSFCCEKGKSEGHE
jgi:hypothetical protein